MRVHACMCASVFLFIFRFFLETKLIIFELKNSYTPQMSMTLRIEKHAVKKKTILSHIVNASLEKMFFRVIQNKICCENYYQTRKMIHSNSITRILIIQRYRVQQNTLQTFTSIFSYIIIPTNYLLFL